MKNLKKIWYNERLLIIIVTIVLILDKITKWLIKQNYYIGESHKVLGNFFKITFIENKGIAFGLFASWDNPIKSILLFLLSIIALAFIIKIYVTSEKTFLMQLSFGLILGGAIGNIFDRVVFGKVVDFLNFGILDLIAGLFSISLTLQ